MKHPVKTINLNQMYVTATRSPGMQLCKASNKNCLCRPFPKPVESVSLHAIWHKDFCKSLVLRLRHDCQGRQGVSRESQKQSVKVKIQKDSKNGNSQKIISKKIFLLPTKSNPCQD